MGKLIRPADALQVVTLDLEQARPSEYLRAQRILADDHSPLGDFYASLQLASKSDYLENKILDHNLGKTSFTMPTNVYLALCTAVPTDASTGTTITEANYTGYARKKIEAANLNAAASGKTTSSAELVFAACTAGSSTVIGFAIVDASTVGNMLYWGTCTSTVISTTQTPPTIASGGFEVTED